LESPATFGFEVNVTNGSHIDVILMDSSQFDEFEDGAEYQYYTHGSDFETTYVDTHIELSSGAYHFVISNVRTGTEKRAGVEVNFVNAR
jgi:hypothetical protein